MTRQNFERIFPHPSYSADNVPSRLPFTPDFTKEFKFAERLPNVPRTILYWER